MKKAKDDKRLQTIPEGVYEAGIINRELRKNKSREADALTTEMDIRYRKIRKTMGAGELFTCSFYAKSIVLTVNIWYTGKTRYLFRVV